MAGCRSIRPVRFNDRESWLFVMCDCVFGAAYCKAADGPQAVTNDTIIRRHWDARSFPSASPR